MREEALGEPPRGKLGEDMPHFPSTGCQFSLAYLWLHYKCFPQLLKPCEKGESKALCSIPLFLGTLETFGHEELWRIAINNTKVWKSMESAGASGPTAWKNSKMFVTGRG